MIQLQYTLQKKKAKSEVRLPLLWSLNKTTCDGTYSHGQKSCTFPLQLFVPCLGHKIDQFQNSSHFPRGAKKNFFRKKKCAKLFPVTVVPLVYAVEEEEDKLDSKNLMKSFCISYADKCIITEKEHHSMFMQRPSVSKTFTLLMVN